MVRIELSHEGHRHENKPLFPHLTDTMSLLKDIVINIFMTVLSKAPKTLSYNEYLRIYRSLNDPTLVTHYAHNGCFLIYRNGKLVKSKADMEEYGRFERDHPSKKAWYEFKFVPMKDFSLVRTSRGIVHCMKDEVDNYS